MTRLFIANRGEIAIRIARAARELGLTIVTAHSSDEPRARHLEFGDERIALPGSGAKVYLDIDGLISAARRADCELVHPGYGFLSESAQFSKACADAGMTFVGPDSTVLERLGDKSHARLLAREAGIAVPDGLEAPVTIDEAREFLGQFGPHGAIMLKAVAGGGGRGARLVQAGDELEQAFGLCEAEARAAFGNSDLYVEELIRHARHIEVQVIADRQGHFIHAFERECTLQRNRQKLVEIAPSPSLSTELRERLVQAALAIAKSAELCGLGTFEFLVPRGSEGECAFAFIEANPRLQVEHTVTEAITGLDLVKTQLQIALGATLAELDLANFPSMPPRGFAVQARISAVTLAADGGSHPATGEICRFEVPTGPGIRIDTGGHVGFHPSPAFDPLLAKLVVHSEGGDFRSLMRRLKMALREFEIEGCETNRSFLLALLARNEVERNDVDTRYVDREWLGLFAEARALAVGTSAGAAVAAVTAAEEPFPDENAAVRAAISGVVTAILVQDGEEVRASAEMAIVEAMKMEHVVAAPCDGRIAEWRAKLGDVVSEHTLLATIEPIEREACHATAEEAADPDHIRPDLAEVIERHEELTDARRPEAVARRRARNQRTARENVADLCDAGSFVEYGSLTLAAQRARRSTEELRKMSPADGLVLGFGSVNGSLFSSRTSRCAVLAYDFTVFAGTQGALSHKKTDRLIELVAEAKLPIVVFAEGGGGRPGETDTRLGLDIATFSRFAQLSGKVPIVGIVSGFCFAGNAALLGCADVVIATQNASVGMGGPAMIEGGGLGRFSPEDVGPVEVQRSNGVVDITVDDEAQAVATAKRYLSYFQGAANAFEAADQRALRSLIPENRLRVYDVREVINCLADLGSVLELRPQYGPAAITALIRVGGYPLGVIANDPRVLSGAIDADAADKMASFLRLMEAHRLPVLSLCDTPGFMVGPTEEARGQVRKACDVFIAGAKLSVPVFTVVLRKAYGLGAQAMVGGSFHRPFFTVSWPTGEFGAMGLEGAVRLGFRRELEAIADPDARAELFEEKLQELYQSGKALTVAEFMEVDDVIDPAETRAWILHGLNSANTSL